MVSSESEQLNIKIKHQDPRKLKFCTIIINDNQNNVKTTMEDFTMFMKTLITLAIASIIPLQAFAEKLPPPKLSGQNYAVFKVWGNGLKFRVENKQPNRKKKVKKVKNISEEVKGITNTDNDVVF